MSLNKSLGVALLIVFVGIALLVPSAWAAKFKTLHVFFPHNIKPSSRASPP
jgi:hypothetical protein